jgi:cyclopropane-fatty-acyl-phospholipid synthase
MSSQTHAYIETLNFSYARRNPLLTAVEWATIQLQDAVSFSKWDSLQSLGGCTAKSFKSTDILDISAAKTAVLSILKNIHRGELTIESAGGIYTFGEPYLLETDGRSRNLKAVIRVIDESFWVRIFLHTDFGFAGWFSSFDGDQVLAHLLARCIHASTYRSREPERHLQSKARDSMWWQFFPLTDGLQIFVLNRKGLSEMDTWVSPLIRTVSYMSVKLTHLLLLLMTPTERTCAWPMVLMEARATYRMLHDYPCSLCTYEENRAHYDLSNEVFAAFLSWDMTYVSPFSLDCIISDGTFVFKLQLCYI